ncbi:MAG: 2-iminoacetate synthase ThiH [Kiritimatiellae bacterium]|nr:2-iminoacetate synthase ThiH [Kiritimatiellia bacterium]MDD5522413.1 2-iminoacetate synthase ThiH [Kiritimatiellia bacterium]
MKTNNPDWLDPKKWLQVCSESTDADVKTAISSSSPGIREFAVLMSSAASASLEQMAQRAQILTRRHFGRTISLYVPLYLSNFCSGGCVYCGFASDRKQRRRKLGESELKAELKALKQKGFEDVLLLTGERTPAADFKYLLNSVKMAADVFHNITIEAFAMTSDEYKKLVHAGCNGMTVYQETYDPGLYSKLHRWGEKKDFFFRLEAPSRALEAGMRTIGIGALLGLNEPRADVICLFQHALHLKKKFWKAGISISFPRICAQSGDYEPAYEVDDRLLAQMIFAFRICFPDMPLVLSTRERAEFRDGIAGVGISRMSAASRTTVGGYHHEAGLSEKGQFDVNDTRDVKTFCSAMRKKGLEPVFKNWESVFRDRP